MSVSRLLAPALMAALALAACKRRDPAPAPPDPQVAEAPASSAQPEGIEWFAGGVDAAFARAREQNKPVFLYWGAEWCPPCHELKAHVFSRPDVRAKLQLFVPVYLDGDTAGAQKWGEALGVSGYPTVVILDADRAELARIAGGMDLSRYAEALDLALGDVRPAGALLASLETSRDALSLEDCRRLAWHGWIVDDARMDEPERTADSLLLVAERCPTDARIERARLVAVAAYASASADAEALEKSGTPSARTSRLVSRIYELLADRELAVEIADALQYLGEDFFNAVKRAGVVSAPEFLARWSSVMQAAAQDPRFAESDRLSALATEVAAVRALSPEGKVPAALADAVRSRVESALAGTKAGYARAGVVNSASWALYHLGDQDRLYELLKEEVKTAPQPYYYMLDLAQIEEERGNENEAIEWLARAYRESKGAATRFQWGTSYVMGLIRMRPEDAARIREATLAVLDELDGPDRIYKRTAARLQRLGTALRKWNGDGAHSSDIAALRSHMNGICSRIPEAEPARRTCDAFLVDS